MAAKNVASQAITLGVHPSHISLGDGENTLSAKVDINEMIGSKVYLHANAEGRDVVMIMPTMDLPSINFASSTIIHLRFDGGICHIFDGEGKNLEF